MHLLKRIKDVVSRWNKRRKLKRSLDDSGKAVKALAQLGRFASSVCVETSAGPFLVDPADLKISRNLLHHGKLNEVEIAFLSRFAQMPNASLLVVGAHIGTVALPVAKLFDRVTLVEANPKTVVLLRRNIALQGLAHVCLIEGAASDRPGKMRFLMNHVNSGGSKREPRFLEPSYSFDAEYETVDSIRLDDVIKESFDVVLMDIEGGEYFALPGMSDLTRSAYYLSVEFLPHLIRNVAGISMQEWYSQIPEKFDGAYLPNQCTVVSGRAEIAEFLKDYFDRSINIDQLIFFNVKQDPACLANCRND